MWECLVELTLCALCVAAHIGQGAAVECVRRQSQEAALALLKSRHARRVASAHHTVLDHHVCYKEL